MSGVANGDGTPVRELFGVSLPDGTGLGGTEPSRTPGAKVRFTEGAESGIPNVGTALPLKTLVDDAGCLSTEQPGQIDDGWTGTPHGQGFTDSGAGQGHTDAWPRYEWQNPAGA